MISQGEVTFSGDLSAVRIRLPKAPLSWRLRNTLRWSYLTGWLGSKLAKPFAKLTGGTVLTAQLSAVLIKADGTKINYGVLGFRSLTNAFITFMVDNLVAETTEWGDFQFHDSGVGVTAENVTDTDIETTDAVARTDGSQVDADPIYRSVGTITYGSTLAITEHGLFSIVTGGTLMDRTVFSPINVVNTDSIQFTYQLTCTAGG